MGSVRKLLHKTELPERERHHSRLFTFMILVSRSEQIIFSNFIFALIMRPINPKPDIAVKKYLELCFSEHIIIPLSGVAILISST